MPLSENDNSASPEGIPEGSKTDPLPPVDTTMNRRRFGQALAGGTIANRRDFLKAMLGSAAAGLAYHYTAAGNEAAPETLDDDIAFALNEKESTNGREVYDGPGGRITIVYTNHRHPLGPDDIPADCTDIVFDNGGKNYQGGLQTFFGDLAPAHYRGLLPPIKERGCRVHLLPPAAVGSQNEDTTLPWAADALALGTYSGVGLLSTRDGIQKLRQRSHMRQGELVPLEQKETTRQRLARLWRREKKPSAHYADQAATTGYGLPAGMVAGGAYLSEPLLAAGTRYWESAVSGKPSKMSADWLRGALQRHPVLLAMNQAIDAVHAAKLRLLFRDNHHENPGKRLHFVEFLGATHVLVGDGLTKPLSTLMADLRAPLIQSQFQHDNGPNALTIAVSKQSEFVSLAPDTPPVEYGKSVFYPPLFALLTPEQQRELLRNYLFDLKDYRVVGATDGQGFDVQALLASR